MRTLTQHSDNRYRGICENAGGIPLFCIISLLLCAAGARATRPASVLPVDNQCLVVHFLDGKADFYRDKGEVYESTVQWESPVLPGTNGHNSATDSVIFYGDALNVSAAQNAGSYLLTSNDDAAYGPSGKNPAAAYRKTKTKGASTSTQIAPLQHWIYLPLPSPLAHGNTYTLEISSNTNTEETRIEFAYDEYTLESPSIKTCHVGYESEAPYKTADIYAWMGDGDHRDFSRFEGKPFHLYNIDTEQSDFSGTVSFWKPESEEILKSNFTQSPVWMCDFSAFTGKGTYRLVVEDMGCSAPFTIGDNRYYVPFRTCMQGFYYQRVSCKEPDDAPWPMTRRPLFREGVDPEGFVVYIAKPSGSFRNMDWLNPDRLEDYYQHIYPDKRTNPDAWGGWADALDWDRHMGHGCVVADMLTVYMLWPEAFTDNQLFLNENNNGLPDYLDEIAWELDFWLRLRDGEAYGSGVANMNPWFLSDQPFPFTVQLGADDAWAWAMAGLSAMMADCYYRGGYTEKMEQYRDSALAAWEYAASRPASALNLVLTDDWGAKAKDLKATAAASLFNITGESTYEQAFEEIMGPVFTGPNTSLGRQGYLTTCILPYVLTDRMVSNPTLRNNCRMSIINAAIAEREEMESSATRRCNGINPGWWALNVCWSRAVEQAAAYRITDDASIKEQLLCGLYSEAEWTAGRNPLGLAMMTGLTDRCTDEIFAPGRNDGVPGLNPGLTPYLLRFGWNRTSETNYPEYYVKKMFPTLDNWPDGEIWHESRYCIPNGEYTPHQVLRHKPVLYGALYAIGLEGGEPISRNRPIDNVKTMPARALMHTGPVEVFQINGRKIARHDAGSRLSRNHGWAGANGVRIIRRTGAHCAGHELLMVVE